MQPSKQILGSVALAALLASQGAAPTRAEDGGVEIARNRSTGLVTWMSTSEDGALSRGDSRRGGAVSAEQAAADFLNGQSAAFGLRQGASELVAVKTAADEDGRDFVRFQQSYQGVPIIGAELNVQVDASRAVKSVNGRSVGDVNLSTQPSVTAEAALGVAVASAARAHRVAAAELSGSTPVLSIHDARIIGGPPAPPALVWRVEVTASARPDIHEFVLVNAQSGKVAVQFNQAKHAAPANATQTVCDAGNTSTKYPCTTAQAVSSPGASSIPDVKNAFNYAEATYDFFARRFGRNSLDGKGLKLVSTVRYGVNYRNAFWNGDAQQMVYGTNYASAKDVVGHELGHGFTEYSSNLLYYYQSGAINESLSDVFGELIQRSVDGTTAWLLGEELPIGAVRNMKDPTQFGDPDKMTSPLWTGDFSFLDQGGVHRNSGVGNKTAFLITDGGSFNGKTVKGIGLDKSAALYYRVNAFILQSSSDYADLANALSQACKDLIGTKPLDKNGKATKAFKKKDCKQVAAAIAATELTKQPQFWPIPAEAPVCSAGKKVAEKQLETFEASDPAKFKYQPVDSRWAVIDDYAASNAHSIYGFGFGQFDSNVAGVKGVKIPKDAYLRFAHFYNLTTDSTGSYAGGVVEYSVDNGAWTRVPATMFADNPYNVTLKTGTGNVIAGQQAFSGFSGGWTSSRISLASLSGKSVKFRFRLATNIYGTTDGWIIDDVRIYGCGASKDELAATAE
ncbi:M4 family metallopeptidase [Methylopila sp. M107]|uniref:M4 family metallopeptidase n=1 Tax=Methylopila sp. M107 TaxID=1101190 RepID=UPI000363E8A7|nr:M4 family metallopeptidase [Methylopila sp. M107]